MGPLFELTSTYSHCLLSIIPYWRAFPFVCRDVTSWECYYFHNFSKLLTGVLLLYILFVSQQNDGIRLPLVSAMLIVIELIENQIVNPWIFTRFYTSNSISLGRFRGIRHRMSQEKISAKVLCYFLQQGSFPYGVAGETAMNITFPILMEE